MKKRLIMMAALFCAISAPLARSESNSEVMTLTCSESDFSITTDANGLTYIESLLDNASYSSDTSAPALPLFSTHITVNPGLSYSSHSISTSKHLIMSDVTIAPNQPIVPTDVNYFTGQTSVNTDVSQYSGKQFPASNFRYVATSDGNSASVLHFRYSPFIYDSASKSLYFIDKLTANIQLTGTPIETSAATLLSTEPTVNTLGFTPLGLGSTIIWRDSAVVKRDSLINKTDKEYTRAQYDYLIITSESLKSAFEPLVTWKNLKGVRTILATVESIYNKNSSYDLARQIKKYINQTKNSFDISYVLLGGDDSIIPARMCYGNGSYKQELIPTDLYYASFDYTPVKMMVEATPSPVVDEIEQNRYFDWDLNKNGVYGEFADSVKLSPQVYLTRLPVRTSEDVRNYVDKLIKYERQPTYSNKMLIGGSKIHVYSSEPEFDDIEPDPDRISDAQAKGINMYNNYIRPYWNGELTTLFDTGTSFPGDRDYDYDKTNLEKELQKGYDFISLFNHGEHEYYLLEKGTYQIGDAANLRNSSASIITTVACNTNAFDTWTYKSYLLTEHHEDPCLSESFLRNPDSGVVAYYGCSREGWEGAAPSHCYTLGPSSQYEANFYKYLFSSELKDKNFGRVVAAAKSALIAESMDQDNPHDINLNRHRWIQFGLNPMGDAEMPIYTSSPELFDHVYISFGDGSLYVNTGVDRCRICVKGIDSNYYKVSDKTYYIDLKDVPQRFSICVTRQNYVPKLFSIDTQADGTMKVCEVTTMEQMMAKDMGLDSKTQPEAKIVNCAANRSAGTLAVSTQIDGDYNSANLVITNLTGNREKTVSIPDGETDVTTSIAALPSGVHVVSLVVDGNIVDSKRVIK